MKRSISLLVIMSIFLLFPVSNVAAHCEVPCGIYDDELRTKLIYEHSVTIEKSMQKIVELKKQNPITYNQLVRWINNKEDHAGRIQQIVAQYFMTQRIKPNDKNYNEKLALLHKMLLAAMKCKQTTDLLNVNTLRSLLKEFESLYFEDNHK